MKQLATLVLVLAAGTASADKSQKADQLFNKAKKLLAEKRYAEACPVFEEVDKIDSGIGAKLNVAKCYEDWGKLATAYRWYEDAMTTASASDDERLPKIRQLAEELDAEVPRILIRVAETTSLDVIQTITLDGKPLDQNKLNAEIRVDPGPHKIEFSFNGQTVVKMAPVERGGSSEVTLDIPKEALIKKEDPKPIKPADDPARTRRYIGLAVGGAGVVAMGVAGILTLTARSKYNDALEDHCGGDRNGCDETGLDETGSARTRANISTGILIGGVAMVGAGVILYLTAKSEPPKATKKERREPAGEATYVVPSVGADHGMLVLGGRF